MASSSRSRRPLTCALITDFYVQNEVMYAMTNARGPLGLVDNTREAACSFNDSIELSIDASAALYIHIGYLLLKLF